MLCPSRAYTVQRTMISAISNGCEKMKKAKTQSVPMRALWFLPGLCSSGTLLY
jgi:hypothetical protein